MGYQVLMDYRVMPVILVSRAGQESQETEDPMGHLVILVTKEYGATRVVLETLE